VIKVDKIKAALKEDEEKEEIFLFFSDLNRCWSDLPLRTLE
jgi:hypothetical protein